MAELVIATAIGAALSVGSYLLLNNSNQNPIEGRSLGSSTLTSSTEGVGITRLFGRLRLEGQIIWATEFKESINTVTQSIDEGGKGGGSVNQSETTEYTYSISFAVAFCEGNRKTQINRLWADGKEIELSSLNYRFYPGSNTQNVDPKIEAIQGFGNTPAYRGIAYIVFEDLELADFGNRVPQITAEIVVPLLTDDPVDIQNSATSFCLIPASGETVYSPTPINLVQGNADFNYSTRPDNVNNSYRVPNVVQSLSQLELIQDDVNSVLLVVSWFGDDLRAGVCTIRPKQEDRDRVLSSLWSVAGYSSFNADEVSKDENGRPNFGGTPSDSSIIALIQRLRSQGKRVVFYPFVLMDIPSSNNLPNPYSDDAAQLGQDAFPWRGRITCSPANGFNNSPNNTVAAGTQINAFFNEYDAMIEHYADLCATAGGVDAFLIGTELVGLTKIRSAQGVYPAINRLKDLASYAKTALPSAQISYSADWSEWVDDAPDGLWFHLDPLWADENIDFCGLDNYLPLSDWREGTQHKDYDGASGQVSEFNIEYLKSQIEGGEYFDYFYANQEDRDNQIRTPITDGAHGKPWVYRRKDFRSWWSNQHFNRPGHTEAGGPTGWIPGSKPIWFTEFGFPAVDKGTNQPNVFYDPKSSESAFPYYSTGLRDDFIQRVGIETTLDYWRNNSPIIAHTSQPIYTLSSGAVNQDLNSYRNQDVTFSGSVVLPASPTDAFMYRMGGTVRGCWIGVRDGGTVFRVRAGDGVSLSSSSTIAAVLDIPTSSMPFDGERHNITWDFRVNPGRCRLWVDGRFIGEASTIDGGQLDNGQWSGSSEQSWLRGDTPAQTANEPQEPWPDNGGDLHFWVGLSQDVKMIEPENMFIWAWDARPYPDFPLRTDVWSDGNLYNFGHWLNGRLESIPLAQVVSNLCLQAGLTTDQFDVSGLYGPGALIRGFRINEPQTIRATLETLMQIYMFDGFESEGKIKFLLRRNATISSVSDEDFVVLGENFSGVSYTRGQETELPSSYKITFFDELRDYASATVTGHTLRGSSQNVSEINAPVSLSSDHARALADSHVQQKWIERNRGSLSLPRSFLRFDPGDAITFAIGENSLTGRLTVLSLGASRECEFVGYDPEILSLPKATEDVGFLSVIEIFGSAMIFIMDLPMATGNEILPHAPRLAAHALIWPGGVNLYDRSVDGTFNYKLTHRFRNVTGYLNSPLQSGPVGLWDRGSVIDVTFYFGGVSSDTEQNVLDGSNALAIYNEALDEWEIIQFASVELTGHRTYKITNLLRGQLGSEHAMPQALPVDDQFIPDAYPIGSDVVLLEREFLSVIEVSEQQADEPQTFRWGPNRYPQTDSTYQTGTFVGKKVGLRPYAPSNVKLTLDYKQGQSDIIITWRRRTRFGGDDWTLEDVPLNEDFERYIIVVWDREENLPVFEDFSDEPEYRLTYATMISIFGSVPEKLTIEIAQFGTDFNDYGEANIGTYSITAAR